MRLIHAVLYTMEGETISDGFLSFSNGKIDALGPMSSTAVLAGDVDMKGAHILPGFVDAHTCLGLKEDSLRHEGNDWNEPGGVLCPQLRAADGFNPDDRAVRYALEGGVTTVAVAPGNVNLIGGQVAAMKLCPDRPADMPLRVCCGLKLSLGEAPKSSKTGPVTRMAELSMLRDILREARSAMEQNKLTARLAPVAALLRGEIPAFIHALRADDIVSALNLGREFGFRPIIVHGSDAALVGQRLAEENVPVIVGSLILTPATYESRHMDLDLPRKLQEQGVTFAITTDHHQSPIQLLSIGAALAVRDGLAEDTALRSITLEPARLLGVDKRVGSLCVGKDADFVVFDGHPFRTQSRIRQVWVDGHEMLMQA